MSRVDLLSAVLLLALWGCSSEGVAPDSRALAESQPEEVSPTVPQLITPSGETVVVELAISEEARARGLMFRSALPRNRGMLFVFPERGVHGFWMKNTFLSLDIIWIDEDLTIVHLARDVPPCESDPCPSYGPEAEASYVLEVESGEAERLGLEPGARVRLLNVPVPENIPVSSEHASPPSG